MTRTPFSSYPPWMCDGCRVFLIWCGTPWCGDKIWPSIRLTVSVIFIIIIYITREVTRSDAIPTLFRRRDVVKATCRLSKILYKDFVDFYLHFSALFNFCSDRCGFIPRGSDVELTSEPFDVESTSNWRRFDQLFLTGSVCIETSGIKERF